MSTDAISNVYGVAFIPPNTPLDFDSLTKLAVNLVPQSSAPSNPKKNWYYLDDGTNTESGNVGLRRYNGSSWVPVGYTLSQDTDPTLGGDLDFAGNKATNILNETLQSLSSDPADPSQGEGVMWISDGTGTGSAGDLLYKYNDGGVIKSATIASPT